MQKRLILAGVVGVLALSLGCGGGNENKSTMDTAKAEEMKKKFIGGMPGGAHPPSQGATGSTNTTHQTPPSTAPSDK